MTDHKKEKDMKKIYSIIALALAAASCSYLMEKDTTPADPNAVQFTTNIGAFVTRATENGFENGDQIGIIATEPLNVDNTLYTFSGNTLTSSTPIHWLEGQEEYTDFFAFYPYDEKLSFYTDYEFVIRVAADQRSHEDYSRSDFLLAYGGGWPGEKVDLEFQHFLSRVDISIPASMQRSVASVAISGVMTAIKEGEAFDEASVTAAEITDAAGQKAWSAIIVPQESMPSLVITSTDGSVKTYSLRKNMEFESGKRYQAKLSVKEDGSLDAEFVFLVFDWLFGDWVWLDGYVPSWGVIGNFSGDWSWDYQMENLGDGVYSLDIYLPEEAEFKFRLDGSWDTNLGCTYTDSEGIFRATVQEGETINLIPGGSNLYYPKGGHVKIVLDVNASTAVITPADDTPVDGEWSVIGHIQGYNWDYDIPMFQCYASGGYYALIYYRTDDEFKLRMNNSWEVNRGGESGIGGRNAVQDGPNILLPEEGVYEIFFYPDDEYLYIAPFGLSQSWGITGSLEGLEWQGDHFATAAEPDSNLNPVIIFKDVVYNEGEEFKIRFGQDWFFEYGFDGDWNGELNVLAPGYDYNLRPGGPNISISESGTYDVYFDLYGQLVRLMKQ